MSSANSHLAAIMEDPETPLVFPNELKPFMDLKPCFPSEDCFSINVSMLVAEEKSTWKHPISGADWCDCVRTPSVSFMSLSHHMCSLSS